MPTGSAGDDVDLRGGAEFGLADLHLVEKNVPRILRDAAQGRVANRARLLVNLLEHEMLEAALFRQDRIPGDVLDLALHRPSVEIGEVHAVGRDHGHIAVGQKENVARVMQNRGHIRRDEVFVVAQPDHRRRPVARRHNLVGIVGRNHRQRKHAGELLHRLPHRVFQRRSLGLSSFIEYFSTRWAMISVSVSVVNLWPSSISFFFRLR